jgi:hypothetical protein
MRQEFVNLQKNVSETEEKTQATIGFKINKSKRVIRGGLDQKAINEQRHTVGPQLSSQIQFNSNDFQVGESRLKNSEY